MISITYTNFDKRDLFNFKAIKLTHNKSNTPSIIKHSIIYSEILRIIRRNNRLEACVDSIRKLKLSCNENSIEFNIKNILYKIQRRQASDLLKFRATPEHIIELISLPRTDGAGTT